MAEEIEPGAILSLDFEKTFPYKFWVSGWSKDQAYPDGFRYKLMSMRHEASETCTLVVLVQEADGTRTELGNYEVPAARIEAVAKTFQDGLVEAHALDFEEQDFSDCRTAEAFEARAGEYGWEAGEA